MSLHSTLLYFYVYADIFIHPASHGSVFTKISVFLSDSVLILLLYHSSAPYLHMRYRPCKRSVEVAVTVVQIALSARQYVESRNFSEVIDLMDQNTN